MEKKTTQGRPLKSLNAMLHITGHLAMIQTSGYLALEKPGIKSRGVLFKGGLNDSQLPPTKKECGGRTDGYLVSFPDQHRVDTHV